MVTPFKVLETDVLVVGGGLAALRAAISARQAGARVIVVVKRNLGRSGSSAITSGGYAVAWSELDELDDTQLHYEDTIVGGCWLNERAMVQALVDEAPCRLKELWQAGVQFLKRDGRYHLSPSGDHRRPRVLVAQNMRGTDMTLPLTKLALSEGIEILENTLIVELLRNDGRVVGAVGIGRIDAVGVVIRAGTTILAAGGAGRLFPVTSNPVDVCGGGFALALKAGADLRDMEFIQFYPWRLIRPFESTRVPIQPSIFVAGAKLYNSAGERFMESYDPVKKEAAMRDISARGIFDQIRFGRDIDGGVRLDISDVTDEDFRLDNRKVVEPLDRKGIDYRKIPLILAPEAHFFMGGVAVDEMGRATLDGLFACGENAGGVHGGNRLNSNSIPETQVFGHRAGITATAESDPARRHDPFDDAIIERWRGSLAGVTDDATRAGPELVETLRHLQDVVSKGLGLVRTGDAMGALRVELDAIRTRVEAASKASLGDLIAALELDDMIAVAIACTESALLRQESRGAHFREDYPDSDPNWLCSVIYSGGCAKTRPLYRDPAEENWQNSAAATPSSEEFVE